MPNPKRRHSKSPHVHAPRPRPPQGPGPEPLPQLPRAQARRTGSARSAASTRASPSSAWKRSRGKGSDRSDGAAGGRPPRVAVDALGGDHGPRVVVEGAVAACREFGLHVAAGRARKASWRRSCAAPGPATAPIQIVDAAGSGRHGREGHPRHAQEALLDHGRRRAGARRRRRRLLLRRQHRRLLDHRQARPGHAGGGGPAGAGRRHAASRPGAPCSSTWAPTRTARPATSRSSR